jgi:hypothetical protein
MHSLLWFLAIAMGSPGTLVPIQNEKPASSVHEAAILKEFFDRIKAYAAPEKKVEGPLPGLNSWTLFPMIP